MYNYFTCYAELTLIIINIKILHFEMSEHQNIRQACMGHLVPTHVLALVVVCCVVQACSLAYHHYTVVDITIKIILVTSVPEVYCLKQR